MAHDRLPQMDILRRYGSGTLAELFGALDPSVIDTDLEMRMHRTRPYAQETHDQLTASADPIDKDLVGMLERFADGAGTRTPPTCGGRQWDLDPNILVSFDPARFEARGRRSTRWCSAGSRRSPSRARCRSRSR